jgi:hypothetical protein
MKKVLLLAIVLGLCMASASWADGYEADLSAGNTSIQGGLHYKRDLSNGFWKAGASGLYTDDDETEYKWLTLDFMVGSDNLSPGLSCEVGVKGIVGDAEDNHYSGDVGALAFAGQVSYVFPTGKIRMPLEIFGGIAYAPEIMSFRDTENYLEYSFGLGVHIVQNASIICKYTAYDMDMESGPGKWDLDHNAIRIGLVMHF